jgi:hypothetical protein
LDAAVAKVFRFSRDDDVHLSLSVDPLGHTIEHDGALRFWGWRRHYTSLPQPTLFPIDSLFSVDSWIFSGSGHFHKKNYKKEL